MDHYTDSNIVLQKTKEGICGGCITICNGVSGTKKQGKCGTGGGGIALQSKE